MSYPPATTSHHHPPPPHLPRLACPGGGGCFLPRLLAKIPPFLSHTGAAILYESERIFFTDFYRRKCLFWGFVEVKRCLRGPVSGSSRFVRE